MPFEPTVELKVNEDGQFVIEVTDTWGTKLYQLSRKESREKAEALLKAQKESA